jgi:hypothetical protein
MKRREAITKVNWMLAGTWAGANILNTTNGIFLTDQVSPVNKRPDTYFLQAAVNKGFSAMAHRLDQSENMRPYFLIRLSPNPLLEHQIWDYGDMCSRFTDAFILGRLMTGSKEYLNEEQALLKLLWTSDPYANPFMAGRMLISYVDIFFQDPTSEHKKKIDNLVKVIRSKMTFEEDYAYYFRNAPGWKSVKDAVFGDFNGYPTFPIGGIILALARYTETIDSSDCEDLLNRLCKFVINISGTFESDGRFLGHTHSGGILTAAAGIMRWAIRHNYTVIIEQMKNTFDWTLKYSSTWGWVPDGLGPDHASCETCAISDVVHLGLLIARHLDSSYYGVLERFSRNQLLANQISLPENFLPKTSFPNEDKIRDALYGSWASYSLPNSLDNSNEVEGCCLGSGILACYLIWDNIVTKKDEKVTVNMALSRNSEWLEVIGYQPYEGKIELLIHDAPLVYVRIPPWVLEEKIRVSSHNQDFPFKFMADRYIKLEGLKSGDFISIEYPLKNVQTVEKVSGELYNVKWRGDTLVAIQPEGHIYPIFERAWMEKKNAPMDTGNTYQNQLGGKVHW